MKTVALFLLLNSIDGVTLFARTRASKNGKSYYGYIESIKKNALDKAWTAANNGDIRVDICLDNDDRRGQHTFEEVRRDVGRLFYYVPGLNFSASSYNTSCFTLDWQQP